MRRLYRLALRAFPPAFRARYGDDLAAAFDEYRDLGRNAVTRTMRGAWAIIEAVVRGVEERVHRRKAGARRSGGVRTFTRRGMLDRLAWFNRDLRLAARSFRRSPGFTLTALVILGLGIGASTSVFSVVNALVLRGAPFPESDRLVTVYGTYQPDAGALELRSASYPDFLDWRDRTDAFASMVIRDFENVILTAPGADPALMGAAFVSPSVFPMLGVRPALGRLLEPGDDDVGNLVGVLSHAWWTSRYAGDPGVVGRRITLNDRSVEIVGVAAAGFGGLFGGVDVWMPFQAEGALIPSRPSAMLASRGQRGFDVFARLRPGVSLPEAQAQLDQVSAGLRERGVLEPDRGGLIVSFEDDNFGDARGTAYVLAVAVALVLLIACANLANLLLARQLGRTREMGLRRALGATRGDLVRQLLVESLALGVAGGALGATTASWMTDALAPDTLATLPSYIAPSVDLTALAFAVGVAVITGVLVGLVPALNTSRVAIGEALKTASRSSTHGRESVALRRALVVVQVAVAVPLLIGSGLMVRSISKTLAVDPGFDPLEVTVAEVTLPSARYTNEQRAQFVRELQSALEDHPAVRRAAIATDLPMNSGYRATTVTPDEPGHAGQEYRVYVHRVSPGYFETLGIRLLDGREFTDRDAMNAPEVVIVSRRMAERFWPGISPVGRTIEGAAIVGVVDEVRFRGLVPDPLNVAPDPDIFLPLEQTMSASLQIAVRGRGGVDDLSRILRDEVRALDSSLPLDGVTTMSDVVAAQVAASRAATQQLGAFGALALMLAAAGLFGVMAYTVSRRTNEIGVRLALGADGRSVVWMMLGQSLALVAAGLVAGLGLAAAGGRLLETQLYGVAPIDGLTYVVVVAAFLLVGLGASAVPAWRASRVDPLVALRAE